MVSRYQSQSIVLECTIETHICVFDYLLSSFCLYLHNTNILKTKITQSQNNNAWIRHNIVLGFEPTTLSALGFSEMTVYTATLNSMQSHTYTQTFIHICYMHTAGRHTIYLLPTNSSNTQVTQCTLLLIIQNQAKFRPNIYVAGFTKSPTNYKDVLMMSEWMIEKPEDFNENWYVVPCPKGIRTLLVACNVSRKMSNNLFYSH